MTGEVEDLAAAGYEALAAGEWTGARDSFQAALRQEETPEGLAGLADALWWLGKIQEAVDSRERDYAAFRSGGPWPGVKGWGPIRARS